MENELAHYGVKGMKWGVRKQPRSTATGKRKLFVSGSSKTQSQDSPYYLKRLPKQITKIIDEYIKSNDTILVGDAPGIDRQVQDYLKKKKYKKVQVFSPGQKARYIADKKWTNELIDASEFEEMSPEWLAKKDVAMTNASTEGLAIILDKGAKATRKNVKRLSDQNKKVLVYELNDKKQLYEKMVNDILKEYT